MNDKMMKTLNTMEEYMQTVFGVEGLLNFGPAHVVFDDFNLDDDNIENCITYTEECLADRSLWNLPVFEDLSDDVIQEVLRTTRQFLVDLLNIPEDERYVYDEEPFDPPIDPADWSRIGRAVEVNIDKLSDDNLIVFYVVYGEAAKQADGTYRVEVRAMTPVRLYENVSRTSLARLAAFMEQSDSELMIGQAQQIREYLLETGARFN